MGQSIWDTSPAIPCSGRQSHCNHWVLGLLGWDPILCPPTPAPNQGESGVQASLPQPWHSPWTHVLLSEELTPLIPRFLCSQNFMFFEMS